MAKHDRLDVPEELGGRVWWHAARRHRYEPHTHDELEFNLATAGRATYLVEGRRFDLGPGSLLWLFPEQVHVLVNQSADFAMWIVVVRPETVRAYCRDEVNLPLTRGRASGPICRALPAASHRALHGQCEVLLEQAEEPDRFNAGLGYLLLSAWSAFGAAPEAELSAGVHRAVERAARLLRDEAEPVSVEALAEAVGLTPARLSRVFARQLGVSLTEYRQRCCLERFVDAYGRGNRRNLTEAALAAGFGSYAQFHRVFKGHFGFGPAEYRRRMRAEA